MRRARATAIRPAGWARELILGGIFAAAMVAAIVVSLLFDAYTFPSESMRPTIGAGDRALTRSVGAGAIERGDIVVYESHLVSPGGSRISRVVALAGDRVESVQGQLHVNGVTVGEPYLAPGTSTADVGTVVVGAESVFILGDNRANARDSRADGPLLVSSITGRVVAVNRPYDRIVLGVAVVSGAAFGVSLLARRRRRRRDWLLDL
jgi:signal peptidase I